MVTVLKTVVLKGTVGSNPTLSAIFKTLQEVIIQKIYHKALNWRDGRVG